LAGNFVAKHYTKFKQETERKITKSNFWNE